jgi:hypothetical protein
MFTPPRHLIPPPAGPGVHVSPFIYKSELLPPTCVSRLISLWCLSHSIFLFSGCRSHKAAAQACLSIVYVILTFLRFSLVLAVLSGNLWVWLSLGLGAGTGYFFLRPCVVCTTPTTSGDCEGCIRLKKARGHYTVQKATLRSKDIQQGQGRYFKKSSEYNNNHEDNQTQPLLTATLRTEKSQQLQLLKAIRKQQRLRLLNRTVTHDVQRSQTNLTATNSAEKSPPPLSATQDIQRSQPHLTATQDAEIPETPLRATCYRKTPDKFTTFLPSGQPSVQNMSNEERCDFVRETFQRLSRSRLERFQRQPHQSWVSPYSVSSDSQSQWDSSFDVSNVDIDDLLNEETYRVQESHKP